MSYTAPAGTNRLLVVTSGGDGGNVTVPSVTFNGAALTQGAVTTSGNGRSGIFYLPLGSSGTATTANVVVTYNQAYIFDVTAVTLQNVDQTTPVSGATFGSTASLNVTSTTGDLVVDAISGTGSGVAVVAGQTLLALNNNILVGSDPDAAASTKAGASTVAMGWTGYTGGTISHVALNVRQATATPLSITTTSLAGYTTGGGLYAATVAATGGTGSYTFALASGTLPTGLNFTSGGIFSGFPSTAGTFNFTISVTDSAAAVATKALSIVVTAGPLSITTTTLPNPVINTAGYSQVITATGGTGTTTFGLTSGALPTGLSLSLGGTISGTATAAGTFNFTISAVDSAATVASRAYALTVAAAATPLAITTTTLPNPVINTAGYSQTIAATGGTGTATFSVSIGTLPTGLALSSAGLLSGTATAAGTFNFTVSATDAVLAVATKAFSLTVAAATSPLTITTTTLPNPVLNTAGYSQAVIATGGTGTTTFGLTSAALPTGLSLSLAGTISGTATAAGTFNFTISAVDTAATVASKAFTLVVSPSALTAQTITFGALANKITSDAPVTLTATASSGLTVSFSVSGPATVNGTTLTLTGTAGTVSVTASQAGNTTFAAAANVVQSFTVSAAPVTTDPGRLKNLSVLTGLQAGEKLTFGFVVGGAGTSGSKPLLVRAGGPALSQLGIPGVLADPSMNLFNGSTQIGTNDNWGGAANIVAAQATTGAFPFAGASSLDAAIFLAAAPAGNLSAIISGPAGATGTVIAEVYDATASGTFTATTPRLVNVSVLKSVGTGFTMGFVLTGSTNTQVLIRAVGPTLTASLGVGGVAPDPKMTLFNGASVSIASNDNWETPVGAGASTAAQISAATAKVAFPLVTGGKDAAIFTTLAPGLYTVTVNVTGPDGLGLVEVYEVP